MSRTKGTPKTGGRAKGTPNKATKEVREWIYELLAGQRSHFEKCLKQLAPEEFVDKIAAKIKGFNELNNGEPGIIEGMG